MNNINPISFKGTINIVPFNWETALKGKPRMLRAMEGFDKFVKEDLPPDVKVTVNLIDDRTCYNPGYGAITGGSFDIGDFEDYDFSEDADPPKLIKSRTPLENVGVTISTSSEKQNATYDCSVRGKELSALIKGTQESILNMYA